MKLFSIVLLLAFFGCNSKNRSHLSEVTVQDSLSPWPKVKPDVFTNRIIALERKFGLKSLQQPVDGEEIRIWTLYSRLDTASLFVLRLGEETQMGTTYRFSYSFDESDSLISIDWRTSSLTPSSGWEKFLKDVNTSEIYSWRNHSDIPKYSKPMDYDVIIISAAKGSVNKKLTYPELKFNSESVTEARKVLHLFTILEREFRINIVN
jgi:hypothetical protein